MCWGVLGRVISVSDDGFTATVEVGGVRMETLVASEEVKPGDVVLIHAGAIISRLNEDDVLENMSMLLEIQRLHYEYNGLPEEEARKRAVSDIVEYMKNLGLEYEKAIAIVSNPERSLEQEVHSVIEVTKPVVHVPVKAFKQRFRVALSDTDYLQVMHYTNYIRFCERVWMELLRSIGFSYTVLIHKYGVFIPTVSVAAKIIAPARMDNEVEVAVWVKDVEERRITYECAVKNLTSGRLAAVIEHVAVCTDTSIMRSQELPRELADRLRDLKQAEEVERDRGS